MIRGTRAPYCQLSGLGLDMFTDDELAELHRATLDVLENAGIMVHGDEAREIFYSHGCCHLRIIMIRDSQRGRVISSYTNRYIVQASAKLG